MVIWVEFVVVDKVRSMSVDEGIKAKAIPPTCREVVNFDTSIPKKKQTTKLIHFRFALFLCWLAIKISLHQENVTEHLHKRLTDNHLP